MSRTYYFVFTIHETKETDRLALEAIERELNMVPTEYVNGGVDFSDSVILYSGTSEEEYADSVRDTVWNALGRFAEITVGWNYIEEYDDHITYDKAAYKKWTEERKQHARKKNCAS